MNQLSYTGVALKKNGIGLGVVARGSLMRIALAVFPDKSTYFISSMPRSADNDQSDPLFLDDLANKLFAQAQKLYRESISGRFVPEMTAYIRSLPEDQRVNTYDANETKGARIAVDDIKAAISSALRYEDPFRAAVDFETRTPYLLADERIIDAMRHIIHDAKVAFDCIRWQQEAALEFQNRLENTSPAYKFLIAAFKAQTGQTQATMAH